MGNRQSCCFYPNNDRNHKQFEEKYHYDYTPASGNDEQNTLVISKEASASNLQHISEREPEECDGDPSIHPMTGTIFLERSKSEVHKNSRMRRRSQYDNHHNHYNAFGRLTKKYSSCSTIFIDDSTVSQPNLRNTIKAVALAIYFHIRNRDNSTTTVRLLEIFDEKAHPLSKDPVPGDYAQREPEHKSIYRFIRTLFNAAQLTAECAIVTLVYLERLLTYAEIEIVPSNWKRIVLGAILLASKVWDDQAVWNVDYCQILKDIPVEEMNELERQFLEMLQFNINVPSSVYAKYYFDLRAMADAHDLSFPLEPLSKERAMKLEAMSCSCEDRLRQQSNKLRRAHSLEGLANLNRNSKAILS
ncbi:hypothetical protein LSH36_1047g00008 [Paralvinella palmiformis]|uniref:Cyclin-like domain-containing protein n=1 Tax=Paralvinella palmiformis TaxID=53620 RepID=A0AAD9MRS6_9ANNE|nr:hypothetical protein LSH36_1047g00008 [Paralvinella palmiformis]